jgi:hypothetical protein
MEAAAVPDIQLDERPSLDLTDDEVRNLHKFSPIITGKVMKYCLAVEGYEDIADATVKGYRDFILHIFTEKKK